MITGLPVVVSSLAVAFALAMGLGASSEDLRVATELAPAAVEAPAAVAVETPADHDAPRGVLEAVVEALEPAPAAAEEPQAVAAVPMTAPEPTVAAVRVLVPAGGISRDELYRLALAASGSESWAAWAVRVAFCESGGNPDAVGRALEAGLMQIHPANAPYVRRMGYAWSDLYDPEVNLLVAWSMYLESGPRPWSCR